MTTLSAYTIAGAFLFAIGMHALAVRAHLIWKVLGVNVASGGIFLALLAAAPRVAPGTADPVPQAMVLTGIVVAAATTAVALAMALRVASRTGRPFLEESSWEAAEPAHVANDVNDVAAQAAAVTEARGNTGEHGVRDDTTQ